MLRVKDKYFHTHCFKCSECQTSLSTGTVQYTEFFLCGKSNGTYILHKWPDLCAYDLVLGVGLIFFFHCVTTLNDVMTWLHFPLVLVATTQLYVSSLPQLFMSFRPYHHLHFIKQTSPVLHSIDTKQQGWQGLIIRRSQFSCKYFQADSSPKTLDITARSVTRPTSAQSKSWSNSLDYKPSWEAI